MGEDSLYVRLGGYDGVEALVSDLLPRLVGDPQLGRFWAHRSDAGVQREKQLLIEFFCTSAGGPVYYGGRDMRTTHRGMGIDTDNWTLFINHLSSALHEFEVPAREREEFLAFTHQLQSDILD